MAIIDLILILFPAGFSGSKKNWTSATHGLSIYWVYFFYLVYFLVFWSIHLHLMLSKSSLITLLFFWPEWRQSSFDVSTLSGISGPSFDFIFLSALLLFCLVLLLFLSYLFCFTPILLTSFSLNFHFQKGRLFCAALVFCSFFFLPEWLGDAYFSWWYVYMCSIWCHYGTGISLYVFIWYF